MQVRVNLLLSIVTLVRVFLGKDLHAFVPFLLYLFYFLFFIITMNKTSVL
jgi:hypothetical protein